jgi:predicted Zn-dependent protease
VGHLDAWRLEVEASSFGGGVTAYVTFIPYASSTWRVTGVSRSIDSGKYLGRTLATTRSFRALTDEQRGSIVSTHLKVVKALKGDDFERLTRRTKNAWSVSETAVYNGMFANQRFRGGELVKIAVSEPYVSPSR